MKFIVDECTGPVLARWLAGEHYDIFSVYEKSPGLDDETILEKAFLENRILTTNDKDFGDMIFRKGKKHKGVILLRLDNERNANKIYVLESLLKQYKNQLTGNFVVVTEKNVRIICQMRGCAD